MNFTDTIPIWDDISLNQEIVAFDYSSCLRVTTDILEEYYNYPTRSIKAKFTAAILSLQENSYTPLNT